MTPFDLINTLLLAGFKSQKHDLESNNTTVISINEEEIPFSVDLSYESIWRYENIHPYDVGVFILMDERVLILYELEKPSRNTWEHHHIFIGPKEAWGFIRDFLQEHP